MLKKLSILLGVFALTFALVACGNDDNGTDDDTEENGPGVVNEVDVDDADDAATDDAATDAPDVDDADDADDTEND